jgi:transcription-repair coupling factor (superfamily II helicase)
MTNDEQCVICHLSFVIRHSITFILANIDHLSARFLELPQIGQLVKQLERAAGSRLRVSGLIGAQGAFVVAGTFAAQRKVRKAVYHLCIAETKEEAAYFQNDLATVVHADWIYFFPDSFKRPAFFDDLNPTQMLQRSEVVNKITSPGTQSTGCILVTYPEALFEKVVSPEILHKNRIDINVGEQLDSDFMIEVLVNYGFERTDFVYEPGQFSIRGGIIDLFSYGNDLPYRIELFDNEVETIRVFDPLTQLSQSKLEQVSIVPNLNTRFNQDQKVPLFSILPNDTVIWIRDVQFLIDRLQYCFDKVDQFAQKVSSYDTSELREIFRDRAFVFPGSVLESIGDKSVIFWR